jgi:hypothetical protein
MGYCNTCVNRSYNPKYSYWTCKLTGNIIDLVHSCNEYSDKVPGHALVTIEESINRLQKQCAIFTDQQNDEWNLARKVEYLVERVINLDYEFEEGLF